MKIMLKDSVFSLYGQKFHRWETLDPAITYYKFHEGIYAGEETNDINVHHRRYYNATFNLTSEIPSLKMSLEDPWVVKTTPAYYQAPYGYRSLGLSAIPEEIDNGSYGGVFLIKIQTNHQFTTPSGFPQAFIFLKHKKHIMFPRLSRSYRDRITG